MLDVALAERSRTGLRSEGDRDEIGEFDHIIVGAGPAGCVLADRLSSGGDARVLLVEAGTSASVHEAVVPSLFPRLTGSARDWNYPAEPETGLDFRKGRLPRARLAGGNGSFDAGLFLRDEALPVGAVEAVERRIRPVRLRAPNPLSHAFVTAAVQYGVPYRATLESASEEGAGFYRTMQRRGRRFGPAQAYLRGARRRQNLRVEFGCRVDRVVIERGRAAGVEFLCGGRRILAHANREVLLCAGSIGTPRILLLSGIGPAATLSMIGLEVHANLPRVGQGLQLRPLVTAKFAAARPLALDQSGRAARLTYMLRGRGPLASNLFEAGASLAGDSGEAAVQLLFAPTAAVVPRSSSARGFTIAATLSEVASRGSVVLRGPDPSLPPLIHTGLLREERDLHASAEAANVVVDVAHQLGLAPFRGEPITPDSEDFGSERWLRSYVEPFGPGAGTCAMDGGDRVVDSDFRVRGIDGLRVVDASVLERPPAGTSTAPVMALGELAAQRIVAPEAAPAMA